jgi:hypothetical protein
MRFDLFVGKQDIREYLASLENDDAIAGVSNNNEECLLARTVIFKYGRRAVKVHDDNDLVAYGNELVVVEDPAIGLAFQFDGIRNPQQPIMSSVTRGEVYKKMPQLRPQGVKVNG